MRHPINCNNRPTLTKAPSDNKPLNLGRNNIVSYEHFIKPFDWRVRGGFLRDANNRIYDQSLLNN